jgi:DNA-binding transcriptional ArsR family regulator
MMLAEDIAPHAQDASGFLKGLANPDRLRILCQLVDRPMCVGDLIAATGIAPTSMSQHLAKLRAEGIVAVSRDHRTLTYAIAHPATLGVMQVLHDHFCGKDQ